MEHLGDCIHWTAGRFDSGYGVFELHGGARRAHRLAYLDQFEKIPQGMILDHRCGVKHCVNVEHLRLVTHGQNAQNIKANNRSKSGVRGVCWDKSTGKWAVRPCLDGKRYNLGYFECIKEAERVAVAWRRENMPFSERDQRYV